MRGAMSEWEDSSNIIKKKKKDNRVVNVKERKRKEKGGERGRGEKEKQVINQPATMGMLLFLTRVYYYGGCLRAA